MKVEIKRSRKGNAVIITFHTRPGNFSSDYERSKFFRGLHGWNQVVPGQEKKYHYRRKGVLDEIPHIKIADSVFLIAMENLKRVMDYFDSWEDKVKCDAFPIELIDGKMKKMLEDF